MSRSVGALALALVMIACGCGSGDAGGASGSAADVADSLSSFDFGAGSGGDGGGWGDGASVGDSLAGDSLAADALAADAADALDAAADDAAADAEDAPHDTHQPGGDDTAAVGDGADATAEVDANLDDIAADGSDTADASLDDGATSAPDSDAGDGATDAAAWVQPPLWDVALIEDANDAACEFTSEHKVFKDGVQVVAWKLRYRSYESVAGTLQPIWIRAFAARPTGGGKRPGVVQAHGLGGYAKEDHATGVAALTGAFVIAYTGPGGGTEADNTSEGKPSGADNGMRMFDVLPDTRGSWFWGHAMAARRALTCAAHHPDVDSNHLGITGFSAGGVTSFLVAGADARVKAAVPLSGTLAWDVATASPQAWQHVLLQKAGLTTASQQWTKLMTELIAPAAALAQASGKLFLVNGSSDEFFPLTAHAATWSVWPGPKWQSIAGNFDHGMYQIYGAALPGGAGDIEKTADLRARGAQRALFHHVFGSDSAYATLPAPPQASLQVQGGLIVATAIPAPASQKLVSMRLWWTLDDAKTWLWADLDKGALGWTKMLPGPPPPNLVWYVDATYQTNHLIPQQFSVSTAPTMPAGWTPSIYAMP